LTNTTARPATGRFCIFCGSRADLSREHVWPQWLRDHLSGRGVNVPDWGRGNPRTGATRNARRTQDGMPEELIRRVCRDCNHGWMAGLESEMKPVFELLYEYQTTITPDMQNVIARWTFKTAAVYEWVRPETHTIRQDQREAFRDTGELPPGTNVNVFACLAEDMAANHAFLRYPGTGLHYPQEVLGVANTSWTTLLAGRVGLSAFVYSGDQFNEELSVTPDFAPLVYPPNPDGVDWPPRRKFNNGAQFMASVNSQFIADQPGARLLTGPPLAPPRRLEP
jgi:hypothetical protein